MEEVEEVEEVEKVEEEERCVVGLGIDGLDEMEVGEWRSGSGLDFNVGETEIFGIE